MGLELGSGGKEEHTQERLVPEPGVCMLVESPREEQLSPDSRVRKAMIRSATLPPSYTFLAPEASIVFLLISLEDCSHGPPAQKTLCWARSSFMSGKT